MKIKGTAVKTIQDFVKVKHPELFEQWMGLMSNNSKEIIGSQVFATKWYSAVDAMVLPTEKLGELLEVSHEDAAWQLGRYSSEILLNSVYKIFLRVANPMFVLGRASNVLSTHYNPASIKTSRKGKNAAVMTFDSFSEETRLAIYRIAGWVEKTIETTGFNKTDINVFKQDSEYVIDVAWSK